MKITHEYKPGTKSFKLELRFTCLCFSVAGSASKTFNACTVIYNVLIVLQFNLALFFEKKKTKALRNV